MKRIEVDPSDVRVVGAKGPERRDSRFGLRLKLAAVLAFAEVAVVVFGDVSKLLMGLVAVGLVAFHIFVGRQLPPLLRQVSWTLALAQALVALFVAALGTAVLVLGVVIVLVLIIGVMLLLGDRR